MASPRSSPLTMVTDRESDCHIEADDKSSDTDLFFSENGHLFGMGPAGDIVPNCMPSFERPPHDLSHSQSGHPRDPIEMQRLNHADMSFFYVDEEDQVEENEAAFLLDDEDAELDDVLPNCEYIFYTSSDDEASSDTDLLDTYLGMRGLWNRFVKAEENRDEE